MGGPSSGTLVNSPRKLGAAWLPKDQEETATRLDSRPLQRSPLEVWMRLGKEASRKADCRWRRLSKQMLLLREPAGKSLVWRWSQPTSSSRQVWEGTQCFLQVSLPGFGPWRTKTLPPLTMPGSGCSLAGLGHIDDGHQQWCPEKCPLDKGPLEQRSLGGTGKQYPHLPRILWCSRGPRTPGHNPTGGHLWLTGLSIKLGWAFQLNGGGVVQTYTQTFWGLSLELARVLFHHIPVQKSQGQPRLKRLGLDPPPGDTEVGVKNLGHFCHPSTVLAIKNVGSTQILTHPHLLGNL